MPTTRPRHMLTETPDIAAALQLAARRWPDERSRSALLARLVVEGGRSLQDTASRRVERRRAAVSEHAGEFPAVYA